MSMYRLMHGENPHAETLLNAVLLCRENIARYRDVFLNADGTKVLILARVGGGNREGYQDFWDDFRTSCPLYQRDYDDSFDSTFAWIEVLVPAASLPITQPLATGQDPNGIKEIIDESMHRLKGMTLEQLQADPAIRKLTDELKKAIDQGGGVIKI